MGHQMSPFQWATDPTPLSSVTPKFIVPEENRPELTKTSHLDSIPVIDMINNNGNDDTQLVKEVAKACEEYGFFQIINHGIPKELCQDVLDAVTKFFYLPREKKARYVSGRHMEDGKIFHYYIKNQETGEKIPMWSEALYHNWHPLDPNFITNLPDIPPNFREVIGGYAKEMGVLMSRILSIISQGLGLDQDYIKRRLGEKPKYTAQANIYPSCPNPEITLGLRPHTDLNIITVLLQDEGVSGLQVFRDGNWVAVDPLPGALVVNLADQLQVLTNDKYKSVLHRAVNNEKKRASFAMFCGPSEQSIVSPIENLVDEQHPPLYRSYTFGEFLEEFRRQEGKARLVKEVFRAT